MRHLICRACAFDWELRDVLPPSDPYAFLTLRLFLATREES